MALRDAGARTIGALGVVLAGRRRGGARLLYGAGDKLWALDPATGKPIESFGNKGVADVHPGPAGVGAEPVAAERRR